MRKSPFIKFLIILVIFIGLGALLKIGGNIFDEPEKHVSSNRTILHLDLEGVIFNNKKFMKHLKKYRDDHKIKAIVININSPGGSVGPSEEIYTEIKRVREEYKKPVICVSSGLLASGAYYSAIACDKIVVARGAMVGSIGVIMQFANLEKLYDWAKVSRYSITSGKFKDSGAEYRSMREDERQLFQDMINEVYTQFKTAVMEGRHLKEEVVAEYADGRVFTGAKAVEMGFADKVGVYEDAVKLAAQEAGLGDDYDIFEIPKKRRTIWDLGGDEDAEQANSFLDGLTGKSQDRAIDRISRKVLGAELLNRPLMLMPGFWGE